MLIFILLIKYACHTFNLPFKVQLKVPVWENFYDFLIFFTPFFVFIYL